MGGTWERKVPRGDRDPERSYRPVDTQRHAETETQAQREMERPERSGVRYRDYERPKETSAEVAKRSGKNMNDIDTETPRGMQGHRKTARQKRPRSLDLKKESALQRKQEVR